MRIQGEFMVPPIYITRFSDGLKKKGLRAGASHVCRTLTQRTASLPVLLKRNYDLRTKLPARIQKLRNQLSLQPDTFLQGIRLRTLSYIESNRKLEISFGAYSYKPGGPPILYASCYAALTRHLYNDLDALPKSSRQEWISYIQGFQKENGLFLDPMIETPLAEEVDWWGWRHLTLHALMALAALGGSAQKRFELLRPFKKKGYISTWLESRNWRLDPASVSNEIQNHAVMLQYARDFQGETWCEDSLRDMFDWLDKKQDPETGLWGEFFNNKHLLSNGVQTGYHLWLLYFYDSRPIHHVDRIIDSCLATQNQCGGFGVPLNSSACEDIDSIDPLVRFSFVTDYRKEDILQALAKSVPWILVNANPDGGWVFRRYEAFQYGHELMRTEAEESSMFPSWFRTLALAYLGKAIGNSQFGSYSWSHANCPGHQFWRP